MVDTIIAKNQTGGDRFIEDLGATVPASGQLTLFDGTPNTYFLAEVQASKDLKDEIAAGFIILNDGVRDLNQEGSTNLASTATTADSTPAIIKCRVATVEAGTLSSSFSNGSSVDGVVLATDDQILIKDQADGSENGVYIVQASGAPIRSPELLSGISASQTVISISEGETYSETFFFCSNLSGSDLVGTDSLEFGQQRGASGGASFSGTWKFDTSTTDSKPSDGEFRFNNGTQSSATQIFITDLTENDVDFANILLSLDIGDRVYIQEQVDSRRYHLFNVTGAVVDASGYVKIPVSNEDFGALSLRSGKECGVGFLFSGDGSPTGDAGGDLGSTYPNPTVRALTDSDATQFPVGNLNANENLVIDESGNIVSEPIDEDELAVVQVRSSTDFTIPASYAPIPFNVLDAETRPLILEQDDTNGERINILDASAILEVTYSFSVELDAAGDSMAVRARINESTVVNGSAFTVTSSSGFLTGGETEVVSSTFEIPASNISNNDYLTIEVQMNNGTGSVLAGAISTVKQLKGPKGSKGDKGDPGGSTVLVEEEGSSLGAFDTLNFIGDNVTATDAGGGQANITFSSDSESYIEFYDAAGGQSYTTSPITVDIDTVRVDNSGGDFTSGGNGEITCNFTGEVRVEWDVSCNQNSNSRTTWLAYLELNGSEEPGTRAWTYSRNSGQDHGSVSASSTLSVTSGQVVRVRAVRENGGGTLTTLANGSRLRLTRKS